MRADAIDYVTVWNGVNDGSDGDHLVAGRLSHKREAPPLKGEGCRRAEDQPRTLSIRQITMQSVIIALDRADGPLTVMELEHAARLSESTVRQVLAELQAGDQITCAKRPSSGKSLHVYSLRSDKEGAAA